jgi:hypothetical protein
MTNTGNLIWGGLIHLSYNMWADRPAHDWLEYVSAEPYLRFDQSLWDDLLRRMADAGMNMVVLDLGDGVQYESHPEIAVQGAWTPTQLRQELAKARALGLEVTPKLNFSTSHDTWLGPYARMVSTETYYRVCSDLITEVVELFDHPRFFHLGMDEETAQHQEHYSYVVVRQYDLWWHDLYFLFEQVERDGARPWVWSDYLWHHPDVFRRKMPHSALQSNWYYGADFADSVTEVKAFLDLEAHGYDQIPTGSNWSSDVNFERTVRFCREHIAPERLFGFLQTVWKPTLAACRDRHLRAIEQVRRARDQEATAQAT